MTGKGMKSGPTYGTDGDFNCNIVDKLVPVHDLNAIILHQLGIDHEKLNGFFQNGHLRLRVAHGHVAGEIFAR